MKPKPQQPKEKSNPTQDRYNIFVSQGILMASKIAPTIAGKASVDTLGNALFGIVTKVEDGGLKHGVKFDLNLMMKGSQEILAFLIDRTGVDVEQMGEEGIKSVVGIAVGKYLQSAIKSGKMTEQQVIELAQQAQAQAPEESPHEDEGLMAPPAQAPPDQMEVQNG